MLSLGECGILGVATGRRGEGFGEVKGDAVELLVRARAGACGPNPGGAAIVALLGRGDPEFETGVPARCNHGAGDLERMMLAPRIGGGLDFLSLAPFHLHSAPSTASSSALPLSEVGALLSSSSSLSVFSSSPKASSSSTGWQSS